MKIKNYRWQIVGLLAIVQALQINIFPSKAAGRDSGLLGCIGIYGAMIFSLIIGFMIESQGYTPAFIISGFLHPISFILVFLIIKKIEPIYVSDINN